MEHTKLNWKLIIICLSVLFSPILAEARIVTDSINAEIIFLEKEDIIIEVPEVIIQDVNNEIKIIFKDKNHPLLLDNNNELGILINNITEKIVFDNGIGVCKLKFSNSPQLEIIYHDFEYKVTTNPIPLWLSVLPPLIAIVMALVFKEVITSLFLGIFLGGAIIGVYTKGAMGIVSGLLSVIDTYIIGALNNWGHLAVIIFSMLIGAVVAVISKNGGMQGVVNHISKIAKSAKSGQFATWVLGVLVFFDDYANTLIVGNTMRPITDRLRISREKLSYIVDSTAAPIAAIAFVTTWIGFELGYIETSIQAIGIKENAYSVLIKSLSYSFYPIFTLAFILMIIYQGKDFGAMLKAERRARSTGKVQNERISEFDKSLKDQSGSAQQNDELVGLQPAQGAPSRWFNAAIPIGVIIIGTMVGLYYTGLQEVKFPEGELSFQRKLSMIIGASDSYTALLWASASGLLMAIFLTLSQRIMNLTDTIDTVLKGFKTMLQAVMILVLAWSLAILTEELHTADFITNSLLSGGLSPILLPALTFILAALISFSTGSSWGAMAILYPLMLPACWQVCLVSGLDQETTMMIFYNVVSCVLAGSVLGDHCSPISDTTILSSLSTSCNHVDHVRTQLPYALTVGGISVLFGTIPGAFGFSPWIIYPTGLLILYAIVYFMGKKVENSIV